MEISPYPVSIFCGALGSGKTEVAANFALNLKSLKEKVMLVDLDIINPYFRTRLAKERLQNQGLEVVCPPPELANADVPALSPSILGALQIKDGFCVCDVGGDDVGAVALGRFKSWLSPDRYQFYFVVNTCRPLTQNVDDICAVLKSIEEASRLKVTALINNTNLGAETDAEIILSGQQTVSKAADILGLPLGFTAADKRLVSELKQKGLKTAVLPLEFYMCPPWAL